MDSATKHLLHALYTNPRDPTALEEVRGHFIKQNQLPALAKVLEWWSAKADSPKQAAEALLEAAQLLERGKADPNQVIMLLEKALEHDSFLHSASIKLEALYRAQGQEEKARKLLEKRIDRISLIEALDGVLPEEQERRISVSSKPSGRFREAGNNPSVPYTPPSISRSGGNGGRRGVSHSSTRDDSFDLTDSDETGDLHLHVPAAPRVPDFNLSSAERYTNTYQSLDDADDQRYEFDDQTTSERRVSISGVPYASEVGGTYGGELETQSVTNVYSSRPPSGIVADRVARSVDARGLQPLGDDDDDDDDDDDEERFYRSYSGRPPDNGGSAARNYEFDVPYRDETQGLDAQPDLGAEVDDDEHWADEQDEQDEEAEQASRTCEQTDTAYRMLASEPLLNPTDIDNALTTIEIDVMWGDDNVLHVAHLSPPRAFCVGDDSANDFLIGRETLGTDRLPVIVETQGGVAVVIPAGATGEVVIDEQILTFETLYENGLFQPCRELTGAYQFVLPATSTAYLGYCGFMFIVRTGVGAKSVGKTRRRGFRLADQTWNLMVAGVVFLMLLCFALRPPESSMLSLNAMNADVRLAQYLIEPPAFEQEDIPEWLQEQEEEGAQDEEQEEQEEAKSEPEKQARTRVHRRRSSSLSNGQRASRLLSALASTTPTGGQTLNKVVAKLGSAGGDSSGNSFSLSNALAGLNGIGGINLGNSGTGSGTGFGIGSAGGEAAAKGVGKLGGGGRGRGKSVRGKVRALSLGSRVSGSLTPGQVLKVINRHMAKIQRCYERGLTRKPTLAGQVKFSWTVTGNGSVSSLRQASSTLGDVEVTQCIAKSISRMRFPKPKGGSVTITFPFIFRRAQ